MISVIALATPAKADAPAFRGDENVACMINSHADDVVEDWEMLCDRPIIPIGSTVPLVVQSSVVPTKVEKPAKKISAAALSTQELVVRVVGHFKEDFQRFQKMGVEFSADGTQFNLYDSDMKDPTYGFIGLAMMKAETYYARIFGTKVSLSKIRSDIDDLQSQLRVLIAKKDFAGQQKWCAKIDARRIDLEKAIENIELSKTKKSPLDDVRAAIAILRRANDNAYNFCKLFTLYHATGSFEKKVEHVVVVKQNIVVTKKAAPVVKKSVASANFPTYECSNVTNASYWWDLESAPDAPIADRIAAPIAAPVAAPVVAPVKASDARVAAPVKAIVSVSAPAPAPAPVAPPAKKSIFAQKKLKL
jgi:hypothetical protein